jgi:PAS domain S-box-containing protein
MKPGVKFLHSLFEVTHVEFQAYDITNHRLLFSSGVVHRLLGYSEDKYTQLSDDFYKSIVHPDDYQTVLQTIDKIKQAKSGDVFEMTVRLLKSDGCYAWVYSRQMIYERASKNNICTIIREVEDVTRLIELEDQLREKVEQLETISFKNSHLLRGPVASIIGLIGLIEDHGIAGDHNRQIMHYLKETITKLDGVIHEINHAAQID